MSWGPINASGNTPAKLGAAVKDAAKEYFDGLGLDDDASEQDGRAQAMAAAKSVSVLFDELGMEGNVEAIITGHVRLNQPGAVPSGISIQLIELEPPHVEPESVESESEMAENGQK